METWGSVRGCFLKMMAQNPETETRRLLLCILFRIQVGEMHFTFRRVRHVRDDGHGPASLFAASEKDGHAVLHKVCMLARTTVLIQDPCPLRLPSPFKVVRLPALVLQHLESNKFHYFLRVIFTKRQETTSTLETERSTPKIMTVHEAKYEPLILVAPCVGTGL